MRTVKRLLKRAAETALASWAGRAAGSILRKNSALILVYHNVVRSPGTRRGDSSLHLDFDTFRRQIDACAEWRLVGLEEALDQRQARPAIAITFDDAYAGAVTLALPELASRGVPATVFVAPELLGCATPWWDALVPAGGLGLDERLRGHCIDELGGQARRILSWAARDGIPLATWDECRIATDVELQNSEGLPGVLIGAHSWSHSNLAALTRAELLTELTESLRWTSSRPVGRPGWLSYPYGRSSRVVAEAAGATGFVTGFSIEGGWLRPGHDPFAIPRYNVPAGLSMAGFKARLHGLLA